jgi:pimeloyl-ACP methyl ester carboxylesterase
MVWNYKNWKFQSWWVPSKTKTPNRLVIAFHGFDRNSQEMENFKVFYPESTAMLSINLLHHGESKPQPPLNINHALSPHTLLHAIEKFIETEIGADNPRNLELELLGYSMGSRIALTLLQYYPQRFKRIIVLAPDGLKKSLLYKFVVHTRLGKACWSLIDRFPRTNRRIIYGLYRAGLISGHKYHFGRFHTDNSEIRQRVAYGWAGHKRFWPEEKKLVEILKSDESIKAHFVFGDRDKIIPYKWSASLRDQLKGVGNAKFHLIESGHVMRHKETVEEINRAISSCS